MHATATVQDVLEQETTYAQCLRIYVYVNNNDK